MTDLTGAELDLAVARVMGRHISTVQPLDGGGVTAGWIDPHKVDAAHCTWHPSRDGAAAWEVWVWLVAQCHGDAEIAGALVADQQHIADDYDPKHVPTYTCRAVVALGEAG